MKVLIACEFSGIVRDAFASLGHDAWSCDILESERSGQHIQGDVLDHLDHNWDLMVAHPPSVSGARWFPMYRDEQEQGTRLAVEFFMALVNAPISRIAVENPVSIMSTRYRKPDQIVQPWQFGHNETKATCWWLKNLPLLEPTNVVSSRLTRVHYASPGPDRWKERSRFLPGMAQAMAEQWGSA